MSRRELSFILYQEGQRQNIMGHEGTFFPFLCPKFQSDDRDDDDAYASCLLRGNFWYATKILKRLNSLFMSLEWLWWQDLLEKWLVFLCKLSYVFFSLPHCQVITARIVGSEENGQRKKRRPLQVLYCHYEYLYTRGALTWPQRTMHCQAYEN